MKMKDHEYDLQYTVEKLGDILIEEFKKKHDAEIVLTAMKRGSNEYFSIGNLDRIMVHDITLDQLRRMGVITDDECSM